MRTKTLAVLLPLFAAATAPAHAGSGCSDPAALDARASSPVIRVSCTNPAWPSLRQVADQAGRVPEAAAPLRARMLREGRRECARGATHVLVAFAPGAVAADAGR